MLRKPASPRIAFLAAASLALFPASPTSAQTDLELRGLPAGRGRVVLGEGGVTGSPASSVVGSMGASVAWVDLNGDGYDELILGAPSLPRFPTTGVLDDAGHVYVLFGGPTRGNPGDGPDLDLTALATGEGLNLLGGAGDLVGGSVAPAGDVNGDGFDDAILGAPGINAGALTAAGGAYILFGAADLDTLAPVQSLPSLAASPADRVVLVRGASAFASAGTSVGGGVDVNNDGLGDVIIGAPLESTNGLSSNGTATILYGATDLDELVTLNLASQGAGEVTVVHGAQDFQLLGLSVVGLGRFDAVLPNAGGAEDLVAGDDVAIGAPGTVSGGLFSGAVYVVRGTDSGTLPVSYTSDDMTGGNSAGLVYPGAAVGDQAGSWVGSVGDLVGANGFSELVLSAPFADPFGRPDAGALYLIPGRLAGVNPIGFDLADVGVNTSLVAMRILGAVSDDGQSGLFAGNAGDIDNDGKNDLAVGVPGTTIILGGPPLGDAGLVQILRGTVQPPGTHTVDLATSSSLQLMTISGEAAGSRAGGALAGGDHNGDGWMDLAIGAPGAPSDPSLLDPTGLAFRETGRGQVVFGPLTRVGTISPNATHFDGPVVQLTVFNLDDSLGVDVGVDGQLATNNFVSAGTPGLIEIVAPVPAPPAVGTAVEVSLTTSNGTVDMPMALTYTALDILTGPVPDTTVPGFPIDFTGVGFSSDTDLTVDIGGVAATILAVDPLAGTLTVEAPSGLPAFTPLDIHFDGTNGSLTLTDAISYSPFVILDIDPVTGPQTSGIFTSPPIQGVSGTPALPVTLEMVTSTGVIPPETTVEFGSDVLGWEPATVTSAVGSDLVVDLPAFLLGQADVLVDVRVTTSLDQVVLTDAFTYEASDFLLFPITESIGFGPGAPEVLAAPSFTPGERMLLLFRGHPIPQTTAAVLFIGIQLIQPPIIFKQGLLGVIPLTTLPLPLNLAEPIPTVLNINPQLANQVGAKFYMQVVTQENFGGMTKFGHSAVLELTVPPP